MTPAYRQHLDRALQALLRAVGDVTPRVVAEMTRRPVVDPTLRRARAEVVDALSRYAGAFEIGFGEALQALMQAPCGEPRDSSLDLDSLGIMDDQRVQEEVEVVQAGRVLADDAGGPVHRMLRFESALRGLAERGLKPSPAGPAAIGRALWRATEGLPLSLSARSEAVRAVVRLLGPALGPIYQDLIAVAGQDDRIAERDRALAPAEAAGERAVDAWNHVTDLGAFDVTRPGALIELIGRRGVVRAASAGIARGERGRLDDRSPAGASVRDATTARQGEADASALVRRIFDEIVSEADLGPEAATRIRRLQQTASRLAERDAGLLGSHQHPVWEFVNQLATFFRDDAARRPSNFLDWLDKTLAVLDADPSAPRFAAMNQKLARWRREQAHRRITKMAQAVGLLRRHAELESQVDAARQRLQRRLDASRADQVTRRFVASVWALVCAEEDAAAAPPPYGQPDAWDTAIDLIWSTSPARSRADAPTLMSLIPALVERLKAGMRRIGLDETVGDAWLERFARLHLRASQQDPGDASTDLPLTLDLALEDELPSETAPAPSEASPLLKPDPAKADESLDTLEIDDRIAMWIQDEWLDAALVWRSENGQFMLFARAAGGTLSMTRRSLEQLVAKGLARLPGTSSALARATRRIAESRH